MRRTLAACLVALSLALTVTPAVVLSAAADEGAGRVGTRVATGPGTDRERATQALERAQALFGGKSAPARDGHAASKGQDATIVLRDLFASLEDLSPAQRTIARVILARPTDGANDDYGYGYTVPAVKKCKGNICIHWVTSTADAPPNRTWVNQMLNLMNHVWNKEVNKLGYRPPVPDGGRGGNSKLDVYLKQLGNVGLYGFCAPERRKPGFRWVASGFCVLDNDFSQAEFPANPPLQNAQVTAAHEFFHAIQFGYDFGEDVWMLEATAVWMEERVFDEVNDNRQYLPSGQVADSMTPLDFFNPNGFNQYGNWPFFEFLSQNYGNGVVKSIWQKAGAYSSAPDLYSTQAISKVLKAKGGFKKVYARFASANLLPAKFYPEGQAWPATTLIDTYTLTKGQRRTGQHGKALLHMTSASWQIKSSSTLASRKWYLKIKVDGPKSFRMPAAYVLVQKRKGFDKKFVKLNGKGIGQVIVPFGRKRVKAVYVSLVNGSTRFKCLKRTQFSCSGQPIDDGRSFKGQPYKFTATVIKRH